MSPRRVAAGRTDELLDGVMAIIAGEGFASLKVSDLARRLNCSTGTLYRIAPSKESLVIAAISRWAEASLLKMTAEAETAASAAARARRFYELLIEDTFRLSEKMRADVVRFESTRRLYQEFSDRAIRQHAVYLDEAIAAGEVRPIDTGFFTAVLRQVGQLLSDRAALEAVGVDRDDAMSQVDTILWEGLLPRA